jgi:HSP20 family protein
MVDRGNAYVLRAALPGVRQEDIHLRLDANTLSIRGAGHPREPDAGANWLIREQSGGTWERNLQLPDEVEGAAVRAVYQDGMLELRLPKASRTTVREVPITRPEMSASDGKGRRDTPGLP